MSFQWFLGCCNVVALGSGLLECSNMVARIFQVFFHLLLWGCIVFWVVYKGLPQYMVARVLSVVFTVCCSVVAMGSLGLLRHYYMVAKVFQVFFHMLLWVCNVFWLVSRALLQYMVAKVFSVVFSVL